MPARRKIGAQKNSVDMEEQKLSADSHMSSADEEVSAEDLVK